VKPRRGTVRVRKKCMGYFELQIQEFAARKLDVTVSQIL